MRHVKHEQFQDEITKAMALDLIAAGDSIDLSSDVEPVQYLHDIGYRREVITSHADAAIEMALRGPSGLAGAATDISAAAFAVSVWLAWYVVLCPQVLA